MDQKKIDRINELAKKARTPEGLTPDLIHGESFGFWNNDHLVVFKLSF